MPFAWLLGFVLCIVHLVSSFPIDPRQVSVSGLSAGGYFAAQYFVAHSASLCGAGIIAGGPYYCAQGEKSKGFDDCRYRPERMQLDTYIATADTNAKWGKIDPTYNMRYKPVWLFSGLNDTVVYQGVVAAGQQFFEHYGAVTQGEYSMNAGHCIATETYGNPCPTSNSPWINKCGYSAAKHLMHHIYKGLRPAVPQWPENVYPFSQAKYTDGPPAQHSLDNIGYYYIPSACQSNASRQGCKLHIAFHGCHEGSSLIGQQWVRETQYNDIAEANEMIVVYPQVIVDSEKNPKGCLDYWGYTGPEDYVTKEGPQLKMVERIIDTLLRGEKL
eukprot:gnl/Trimastix_PCT/3355.p1 GENE.gnl/Trimastix_PCT/3355~~gnl/Trimastix_PCT/3355.p1  ORF type:complete len:344 (+),score=17.52 gnl/Trimastix_PCT/3355:48-1034(+)